MKTFLLFVAFTALVLFAFWRLSINERLTTEWAILLLKNGEIGPSEYIEIKSETRYHPTRLRETLKSRGLSDEKIDLLFHKDGVVVLK